MIPLEWYQLEIEAAREKILPGVTPGEPTATKLGTS
jgi:hypothetical protein